MRALWNGSISFGLISIPVQLYSGSNPRQGIDLSMLHKADHSPIRYERVCRKDGKEIPWDDIVKGYEYREGDYIVLTQKELDELNPEKTQTIDILQFVEEEDIDIRYFEKPYYLEPGKGGDKAYALLRATLKKSGKVALARFVMREHALIAVIKPVEKALVLNQMRFPSDLREPTELHLPSDEGLTDKEVEMALKLVQQETKPFIAEDLHDTYTDELEELIKRKAKGKKIVSKPAKEAHTTNAKDLMSALKASLKD